VDPFRRKAGKHPSGLPLGASPAIHASGKVLKVKGAHYGGESYEAIKKAYEDSLKSSLNNLEA